MRALGANVQAVFPLAGDNMDARSECWRLIRGIHRATCVTSVDRINNPHVNLPWQHAPPPPITVTAEEIEGRSARRCKISATAFLLSTFMLPLEPASSLDDWRRHEQRHQRLS